MLEHNPAWSAADWSGEVPPSPSWLRGDFVVRADHTQIRDLAEQVDRMRVRILHEFALAEESRVRAEEAQAIYNELLGRGDLRSFTELRFGVGELILVACIFMWSAYTLVGRVALSTLSPLALTTLVMAAGTLPLAFPAWVEGASLAAVTWRSWAALGYLVVFGTVIPFLWFYEGVKALGAARASQWINLVPPLAVLESIWLLDEPLSPGLAVGTVLVVAGLYLTNKPKRTKKGSEQFSGR